MMLLLLLIIKHPLHTVSLLVVPPIHLSAAMFLTKGFELKHHICMCAAMNSLYNELSQKCNLIFNHKC